MKIGLYIHIPFCKKKCLYCDFPSHANLSHLYQPYVAALCREISDLGGVLSGNIVDTIFIGGGTPTILSTKHLRQILQQVHTSFLIDKNAEISIEANPGTIDLEKMLMLRAVGVNRISFGVQTFNDPLLVAIGRIHSAAQGVEAIKMAKEAGFVNINIDLMSGLPGQTTQQFSDSVLQAVELDVTHVSAYGLKVEEGTPFARMQQQGCLILPNEDIDEAMYDLTTRLLPQKGFTRYEISNYAKQGYECRHNLKYWQFQPYIGVGAAAHSFWQGERLANMNNVGAYIGTVEQGLLPVEVREKLENSTAMPEYIFLALRTVQGMSVQEFNYYFNTDFFTHYGDTVAMLTGKGLLVATENKIFLTEMGMKFGNVAFCAFLP